MVLAQILAQMKDRGGRIKIPGFYDDVVPLSDEERAEWKKLPFNETKYRKDLGAPKLFGESGYTTLERVWARPTFEVNGLLSGFTGEGAKTVLPATAMAKVSMRLVPNQDPEKIGDLFEAYVQEDRAEDRRAEGHAHARRQAVDDGVRQPVRACRWPRDRAGLRPAPVFNREGGSIPVVATFQEELGLPSVLFGVGLPDENAHAPDEKLDLGNFHNGIIAASYLLQGNWRPCLINVCCAGVLRFAPAASRRSVSKFLLWEILFDKALPARRDLAVLCRILALMPDSIFRAP